MSSGYPKSIANPWPKTDYLSYRNQSKAFEIGELEEFYESRPQASNIDNSEFIHKNSSGIYSEKTEKQTPLLADEEMPMSRIKTRIMKYVNSDSGVVFIKSLKKTTVASTVSRVFSRYARVRHVELPFNKSKAKNIGYGYVAFFSQKEADFLVENIGEVEIDGRQVKIRRFELDLEKAGRSSEKDPERNISIDNHPIQKLQKSSTQLGAQQSAKQKAEISCLSLPGNNGLRPGHQNRLRNVANREKDYYLHDQLQFHSTKPTKSYFHWTDGSIKFNHELSNLVFRVCRRE